ncbi:hypothetical protein [uncultured Campylobacter sp.]|uniref:hypothetical protein n=1 Tax=uncultured Campylobacter sp. TaxID=218934 RepID=UPI0015B1779F|nr:hypothetical protein [uncultured Campylobacter sp.]
MLIYCALNAAFALLGLALCGSGFFGSGSFGVRALAWLLSLEAGFLGAFGAVYFSFRAYRNKIEDELRAGKYDEILRQSPKNSTGFMNDEISANDTNSASRSGENQGGAGGSDEILCSEACDGEILKSESFSSLNLDAEIPNARNSEGAVNFTSGETSTENDDSHALYDETFAERAASSAADEDTENFAAEYDRASAGERDVNSTKSDDKTSAYDTTALGHAADKFNMNGSAIYGDSHGSINDEASDSSQDGIGERCDDLKNAASSYLGGSLDSSERSNGVDHSNHSGGADRSNHSDGTDSGNRGGDVDSSEPSDGTSDFGGGIGIARNRSKDDFDGADDWDNERKRGEVRSNFAGAFFSPFKILSYAALVAAIYLLAKLSLLNPLAIILGVTIIPLGTMIAAFGGKDAR